ncbi:hypothetical protein Hypma_005107 [Hypsizygus marmoreus]|uniref:Uncharacterized protein n=1 Tax=Hypsizygus marmoreus TaxID=39966 RepID=A0A369K7P3_HYPMA|nr:hypothetical protein Hypma_005107 [Hypsizygus marmoreus]
MPLFNRPNQRTPVPIAIQVETEVQVDVDLPNQNSHGPTRVSTIWSPSQPHHPHLSSPQPTTTTSFSSMSLPRAHYDPRRVCLNPFPEFSLGKHRRTVGVYLAGALFALANWTFLDAAVLSAHAHSPWGQPDAPPPVHVTFVDWIPGICSLLGYIVINLIDKDRVRGEEGFGDSRAVWRARLFLFIGFALMAGGLAGSVTVLILKYILNGYPEQFTYYGYANVSQSVALMLSAVVLWIAQSGGSEYEYNLTL